MFIDVFDITDIAKALIALIMAIVSAFLIPWLKSKLTTEQRTELIAWVKIAVTAAEQIYNGQGRGAEKKQYVLDFLKSKGFSIDEQSIDAAIESAVQDLNLWFK